jgi:2-succinyl-6-hydroxy-2,4-cyclohexadiene-1-carboxylate synthase
VTASERPTESESESLVLLHGFGGTHRAWDRVVGHLPTERYRPLALDLPGHGDRADAPRQITFEGCVASVLERSPERFVLGGYSMGGRIALHMALAAPGRVSRLVLVGATAGIDDEVQRARRRDSDGDLARGLEDAPFEEFMERWGAQPVFVGDPPEVDELARSEQLRNRPAALAAALRGVGTGQMQPLWSRLGELAMPVSVLVGERDLRMREPAERMARTVPYGELRVLPGGHRLLFENAPAVAEAISQRRYQPCC